MKDHRLRIGMRFVQQGREFVIEGPLPPQSPLSGDQLKIKDTVTGVCSARPTADLLEALFAGRLELIGDGNESRALQEVLARRRVSDLTLLDDGDPLKAEALRRLHYVRAVFDERPRLRTRETLSPIIERVSREFDDPKPPSPGTLKRWSRIYERAGEDVRALVPAIKARGNRRAKYSALWESLQRASISCGSRQVSEKHYNILWHLAAIPKEPIFRMQCRDVQLGRSPEGPRGGADRGRGDSREVPEPGETHCRFGA